ncbi:MAG: outer membrane beta-barrel protein [Nitrospirales bacterium]
MRNQNVFRPGMVLLCLAIAYPTSLVSAAFTLESSVNLTQTYTDNLFYNDKDREDDFGTLIGPNLALKYDSPDIVIGGTYFGRLAAFVNHPDQNRYIQNVNILLDLPFLTKRYKKLSVTVDETMNFTPQLDAFSLSGAQDASTTYSGRGGTVSGGTGGSGGAAGGALGGSGFSQGTGGTQGVFTSRASAFSNFSGITLAYAMTPSVTPTFTYNNRYLHFFSSGFQDSVSHIGKFSVPYGESEQTTIIPSYTYLQTDYLGTPTQVTISDKLISHQPRLAISYKFTPLLAGSIQGGATFSKQIGAEETQENGVTRKKLSDKWQTRFTGGATVTKIYRNGNLSLSAYQTIGGGGGLASQAASTQTLTGRIQHNLSTKLSGFGSLGYARNKSTGGGSAFDTNTYRVQAGISYSFLSWLSGNFNYSHINQKSNGLAVGDIKVNQFFIGLTAFADPWVLMR